jgi:hypothetical protein
VTLQNIGDDIDLLKANSKGDSPSVDRVLEQAPTLPRAERRNRGLRPRPRSDNSCTYFAYRVDTSISTQLKDGRMLTDNPPRARRAEFLESERIKTLDHPQDGRLLAIAKSIESAIQAGTSRDVRRACEEFLHIASEFYQVPACEIRVLAARPLRVREHWTTELFGDYTPETMRIRVWMRTAVRKDVTSFGTLLSTLCHEFCHHLDFHKFGLHDSWHTRGFYERAAALYHHARDTSPKQLFWFPVPGGRWRIDWPRTNRGG